MDGIELAALYALQHRLAGHAEQLRGLLHHHVAVRRFFDEALAHFLGQADLPGRAGRDLLARYEAFVDPAMEGRRCDAEDFGGLLDAEKFTPAGNAVVVRSAGCANVAVCYPPGWP
jgi:hypothetical protein